MAFQKNDSNCNRQGRPRGVKNQTPAEIQKFFLTFLSRNMSKLQADFDSIVNPADRIDVVLKMAKLILPKAVEIDDKRPLQPILKIEVTKPEYADELRKLIDSIENEPESFTALPQAQTDQPAQFTASPIAEQPAPPQAAPQINYNQRYMVENLRRTHI